MATETFNVVLWILHPLKVCRVFLAAFDGQRAGWSFSKWVARVIVVCSQPSTLAAVTVFFSSGADQQHRGVGKGTAACGITVCLWVHRWHLGAAYVLLCVYLLARIQPFWPLLPLFSSCSGWRDPAGHAVGWWTAGVWGAHELGWKFHANEWPVAEALPVCCVQQVHYR